MTDRRAPEDQNDPPEDVASLFSWANLRGAKYKDFSASRALNREKARAQLEQEREQALREAEAQQAEAARLAAEAAQAQERARQAELAAHQAAERASQVANRQPASAAPDAAAQRAAEPATAPDGPTPQSESRPQQPAAPLPQQTPPRNPIRSASSVRTPWSGPEGRDLPTRPAWLTERRTASGPAQSPEDTLQGSRERLTSRWFALKSVLDGGASPTTEAAPAPSQARPPVLAVFSLAGGVGKTSIVATLGRSLSSRAERVLLVDTAAFGLLPFYFGARDQRPGQVRTFAPPVNSGDAPIQMISIELGSLPPEQDGADPLAAQILEHSRGVSRVILDLATASGATARRILSLAPLVLVPVVPDMNSVVAAGSLDSFFERNSSAAGRPILPYYVFNQFDASQPLHLDVREVLREQLGDRLLPFALRRTPAVSEALAEGMTVIDYAPTSTVADDFGSLAAWVKSQSAPASTGFRGVRWSER